MNPATCVNADKTGFEKLDLSLNMAAALLVVELSLCS